MDIQDFGLIDNASVEFSPGLNVLTGETGAGKSIVIDALQMALGHRVSTDLIRTGREKARVTAIFEIGGLPDLIGLLSGLDIEPGEDGTLLLAREISKTGRNICRLNGQAVPLNQYREIGSCLVDSLSQHEQHSLLSPQYQLNLLDSFGGPGAAGLRKKIGQIYTSWRSVKERLLALQEGARERLRRLEMLRFQIEEIDRAKLSPEEDEILKREHSLLVNAEKVLSLAGECCSLLCGGDGPYHCVTELLSKARQSLLSLSRLDDSVKPLHDVVEDALYQMQDTGRQLSAYRDNIHSDPEQLKNVEERLFLIRDLKRKYSDSIAGVLEYRDQAAVEIEALENNEDSAAALEKDAARLEEEWLASARELSKTRRETARKLKEQVKAELASLEMGKADFLVSFEDKPGFSASGLEKIEYLISPNPGEPLKPLTRIASGGELARVILALRTILARLGGMPTLVFDEVDTGIGGRTLQSVAEKLSELAAGGQVICVTHAAVIAARADTHFHIAKEGDDSRTAIRIEPLGEERRVQELTRMLSGSEDGLASEYARQMLEDAGRL
ncbi:MAG: DNA repair protein RecN [Desulfotomaculum sp. 46_296]|nr:MAG: DNA repair protein RecN [Desulfotomaculum sp. 46_296]